MKWAPRVGLVLLLLALGAFEALFIAERTRGHEALQAERTLRSVRATELLHEELQRQFDVGEARLEALETLPLLEEDGLLWVREGVQLVPRVPAGSQETPESEVVVAALGAALEGDERALDAVAAGSTLSTAVKKKGSAQERLFHAWPWLERRQAAQLCVRAQRAAPRDTELVARCQRGLAGELVKLGALEDDTLVLEGGWLVRAAAGEVRGVAVSRDATLARVTELLMRRAVVEPGDSLSVVEVRSPRRGDGGVGAREATPDAATRPISRGAEPTSLPGAGAAEATPDAATPPTSRGAGATSLPGAVSPGRPDAATRPTSGEAGATPARPGAGAAATLDAATPPTSRGAGATSLPGAGAAEATPDAATPPTSRGAGATSLPGAGAAEATPDAATPPTSRGAGATSLPGAVSPGRPDAATLPTSGAGATPPGARAAEARPGSSTTRAADGGAGATRAPATSAQETAFRDASAQPAALSLSPSGATAARLERADPLAQQPSVLPSLVLVSPRLDAAEAALTSAFWWKTALLAVTALLGLAVIFLMRLTEARERATLSLQRDFISTVSHELRTPLASIRVLAETLERKLGADPAGPTKDYPRRLVSAVDGLGFLVENILSFNRIEAGRLTPKKEPLALTALEPMLRDDIALMVERPVQLSCEGLAALGTIEADVTLLRILVLNLLRNTWKYARADNPAPHLTVRGAKGAHRMVLTFTDDGPGIAADAHERVFEPFHRQPGAENVRGSGLGLALSRRIAELHGGTLRITESSARGTTFELTLPVTG